MLIVAVWSVSQIIGFSVLHYPWDAMTLMWGGILGAVAVLSTGAALAVVSQRRLAASALVSFAAAFIVHESSRYLVSIPLGATEDFTPAIFVRILGLNAASFGALLGAAVLAAIYAHAGSLGRSRTPLTAANP